MKPAFLCAAALAAMAAVPALAQISPSAAGGQLVVPPAGQLRSAPLPAPNPQTVDLARQFLDVILPPASRNEVFMGTMRGVVAQMIAPTLVNVTNPGLRQLMVSYADELVGKMSPVIAQNVPPVMEAQARAYAREFSLEELKQMNAFAATPAGAHYLKRNGMIPRDPEVMAANQTVMMAANRIAQEDAPNLIKRVRDYMAAHPEAATKP